MTSDSDGGGAAGLLVGFFALGGIVWIATWAAVALAMAILGWVIIAAVALIAVWRILINVATDGRSYLLAIARGMSWAFGAAVVAYILAKSGLDLRIARGMDASAGGNNHFANLGQSDNILGVVMLVLTLASFFLIIAAFWSVATRDYTAKWIAIYWTPLVFWYVLLVSGSQIYVNALNARAVVG